MILPKPGSDTPEKVHLLKVYEQTGKKPKKLLEQPEPPEELLYLWEWSLEILSGGGFSWTNVEAWANLKNFRPHTWETDLLFQLSSIYVEINAGRYKPSSKS